MQIELKFFFFVFIIIIIIFIIIKPLSLCKLFIFIIIVFFSSVVIPATDQTHFSQYGGSGSVLKLSSGNTVKK